MQATEENQNSMFYPVRFFPGEREVFRKKDRSPTKDWAEENIYITKSSKPGMYKNSNNPPLAGLLDILDRPNIRRFVLRKCVQGGGSLFAHIFMLRRKTQSSNTTMIVMADREKMKNVSKTRLLIMMRKSPGIQPILSENPDDTAQLLVQFRNGSTLLMAWAGSESAVSSDPCEDIVVDEVDKYKNLINLEEIKDRTTTYGRTSKAIFLSTPAGLKDPITVELHDCDVICDCHVACPDCGKVQIMTWDRINYPGRDENIESEEERKALANKIERHSLARYECKHCDSEWDDYKRNEALESFEWVPRKGSLDDAISAGAQYPSWVSAVKSLSLPVARWLRAQGYPDRIKKWYNNEAGEPHEEETTGEIVLEDDVYARRYQYYPDGAKWRVPMKACLLIAAVDVQQSPARLECEVVAWAPEFESWGIEYHQFPGDPMKKQVWNDLDEFLKGEWFHESGVTMKISAVGIDTGYLPETVDAFIEPRRARRFYGVKGAKADDAPLYRMSTYSKKKNKKVPRFYVGTHVAKDMLITWLQNEEKGPGYMHLPLTYDFEYCKQVTSEMAINVTDKYGKIKRKWVLRPGHQRNEPVDIRNYNLAVLQILNPNYKKLAENIKIKAGALKAEQAPETPEEGTPSKKVLKTKKKKSFVNNW